MVKSQAILCMNIVYTINNIFHQHSTSQESNIIRHQLLAIFFDKTLFDKVFNPGRCRKILSKNVVDEIDTIFRQFFSTFHDNFLQRKPGDAKNVVVCR